MNAIAGRGKNSGQGAEEQQKAKELRTAGKENERDLKTLENPKLPEEQRKKLEQQVADRNNQIDEGLKTFPDSPVVNTAGSEAALSSRNLPKALDLGDKAVSLARQGGDPEEIVPALTARASAKLANRDKTGALADIEAGLKLKKDDPQLLGMRGLVMGHAPGKGYKPPASAGLLDGHRPDGNAPGSGKPQAAAPPLKAAAPGVTAEELAANASALSQQKLRDAAMTKLSLNDAPSAKGILDRAVAADSRDALAYALRARANRLIREHQAARGDAATAIGLDSKLAMAYAERALAGMALGYSPDDYLKDWEQAGKLDKKVLAEYQPVFDSVKASVDARKAEEARGAGTAGGPAQAAGGTAGARGAGGKAAASTVLLLLASAGAYAWWKRRRAA